MAGVAPQKHGGSNNGSKKSIPANDYLKIYIMLQKGIPPIHEEGAEIFTDSSTPSSS
jgi:hypothetical protein